MTTGLHYYYNQVKGRLREGAESWHVILAQRNSIEGNAADDLLGRPTRFTLLPNPPGHFLADPFVVNANGQEYLFVEDYDYSLGRGIISCACLPSDEAWSTLDFKPVLRCDWHLSYPYVFEHEGCFYMVPEAAESGGVDLYQADEFPWRWRHVKRLIEGANIVDATLILHNNLWWLFAAIGEANTSTWDELFLYYAPSPLGPWQPHPQCPLKTDISSARPAGRPFWHDGRLLRPAQDCTLGYGSGLTLCEVVELTPTGYRERPYRHSALVNAGHIGGTHTFNASLRHVASDIRIKTKLTKPAHVDLQWVDIKNTTPSLPKKTMNKHPHHPPPAIRSI
ncbi:MAG: hypothetical protein JNM52_02755 [Betaproteobacteria bacterium]|nr:hypothetical protein [Betaproteobacteria bacterium]